MALEPIPEPVCRSLVPAPAPTFRLRSRRGPLWIGARVALAMPLLVTLSACDELARFIAKPEPKSATEVQPKVAAKPEAPAEVEPGPIPKPQEKPKPGKLYEWGGQDRKLTRIIVNTDEQKARFYVGDEQVGWTTVASGLNSHPTPVGHFEVLEKSVNKRSNLYGKVLGKGGQILSTNAKSGHGQFPSGARFEGASMPYYMRITYDGVGLHAGPIPHPGRPASHGCIRLPAKLAPVLFEHVGVGTQVSIVGVGPDWGNYAAKQRAYAAEQLAKAQERKEVEARRAQAIAASGAPAAGTAATATPAEPKIAMAEPAARPAAAITEPAAEPSTAASRTVETLREHAPAAAPAPRRTAAAPVSRPRPGPSRNRPAPARTPSVVPAVAQAEGTPAQASPATAPLPAATPGQAPAGAPDAAPTTAATVQALPPASPAPAAPTPAKAETPQASPAPVAAAAPPSPQAAPAPAPVPTAPPAAKAPEAPAAKAPQVAAEPAAAPTPAQPAASTTDKPAGG